MAWWGNLAGTVTGYLRLGLSGVRLKESAGELAVRDAADGAFAKVQIADGTAAGHAVSKGQTDAAFQPKDATLTALAGLATGADKLAYSTGVDTFAETPFTAAARTVLDDATVAAMVDTLGGAASTGTGGIARATSPTFVTPALGTPASGVLTNATGLPTAGLLDDAVTYAKIQNVSATDKLLGRATAGAGDVEEIACTPFARTLLDDADAPATRITTGTEPTLLTTLTTTALATTVEFTGLDINTHNGYRVEVDWVNGTALDTAARLFVNALTTDTDHYRQSFGYADTTLSGARTNDAYIISISPSDRTLATIDISLAPGGYAMAFSAMTRDIGTKIQSLIYSWTRVPTVTNITSLTFTSNNADGFGIGTKFRIYRKDK